MSQNFIMSCYDHMICTSALQLCSVSYWETPYMSRNSKIIGVEGAWVRSSIRLLSHCSTSMDVASFGVTDSDRCTVMELPFLFNTTSSSGYLEDVIADWKYGFKQQHVLSESCNKMNKQNWMDQADPLMKFASTATNSVQEKEKKKKEIAYPFDIMKRGGVEGNVTLEDINHRMLLPPTKPIPHPVGEYATHSYVSSASGFGISGKEVVALTKIYTHGGGTIVIIRTKG